MPELFDSQRYDPENDQKTATTDKQTRLEKLNLRKRIRETKKVDSVVPDSSADDSSESSANSEDEEKNELLAAQLTLPDDNHKRRKLKHASKIAEHSTHIKNLEIKSLEKKIESTKISPNKKSDLKRKSEKTEPTVPETPELTTSATELSLLNETLRDTLESNNITTLFPCQTIMLSHLLNSQFPATVSITPEQIPCPDLLVRAPTGSGKTLAFVLPILEILSRQKIHKRVIRVIAILPTRTLAKQVHSVFQEYGSELNYKSALLTGGNKISLVHENLGISKYDILVATPGKLVDYLDSIDLNFVRFLVIDEADQVLGETKQDWLEKLEKKRNPIIPDSIINLHRCTLPFQKLLFSATLTDSPKIINSLNLFAPRLLSTSKSFNLPASLNKKYMIVNTGLEKILALKWLLMNKYQDSKVLIFCSTVQSSERLAGLFNIDSDSVKTEKTENTDKSEKSEEKVVKTENTEADTPKKSIKFTHVSSEVSEKEKKSIISKFIAGKISRIVTTDQLSRGMDLEADLIIEFDCSRICETYIHRVGRTARAGRSGQAITILKKSQVTAFKQMMKPVASIRSLKYEISELESFKSGVQEDLEALKERSVVVKKFRSFNSFRNQKF
jgi:ATP-dependent RNA helicase DDX51/DBP6